MTQKKLVKPKDPNAPKRPQSSYFLFMNERRPILKEEHKDKSMTDISKLISAEWKALTDKTKYENKAAKLKAQYKIDLDEYKQTSNYSKFQKKLQEWQREQRELKEREQNGESITNGNTSHRKKRSKKKQESSSEEEESEEESSSDESGGSGDGSSSEDESGSEESEESDSEDDDVPTKKKKRRKN